MSEAVFGSYASGYMSAYNFWSTRPLVEIPEYETILAYLDKYCADHPLNAVSQGVDALIGDLGGYKLGKSK